MLFLAHYAIKGLGTLLITGSIGLIGLIIGYSILHVTRISVHWVTWIIGSLIILGCIIFCVSLLIPHTGAAGLPRGAFPGGHDNNFPTRHPGGDNPDASRQGGTRVANLLQMVLAGNLGIFTNVLGAVSVAMGVYATTQWLARQSFLSAKKYAVTLLIQPVRNFLMFARKQHQFFGWLAVIAAASHMAGYLPALFRNEEYEIITGFIAIGVLVLMAVLGTWLWFENVQRKRTAPPLLKTIHSSLTIAFALALIAHI